MAEENNNSVGTSSEDKNIATKCGQLTITDESAQKEIKTLKDNNTTYKNKINEIITKLNIIGSDLEYIRAQLEKATSFSAPGEVWGWYEVYTKVKNLHSLGNNWIVKCPQIVSSFDPVVSQDINPLS